MYRLNTLADGKARITSEDPPYDATFNVVDEADAVRIVLELNRPAMLEALANHRFQFETGGLEVANGLQVLTDRESQSQLSSTYTDLKQGLIPDTEWKAVNGWQVVDLASIEPIAKAMAAHRRACFRGERQVQTAINDAATIGDIEAIQIIEQFQTAYQAAFAEVMEPA